MVGPLFVVGAIYGLVVAFNNPLFSDLSVGKEKELSVPGRVWKRRRRRGCLGGGTDFLILILCHAWFGAASDFLF